MANLVHARLADATHRLPHPFRPATDFPAEGQTIDREDPVWMQLVNDGSLIVNEIEAPAVPAAGKRKEKN
ncbi:MAG: hypothetical protein EOR57_05955 [Mesorhizobium sp.]|uniref:hypothetical protein n=1 Tax=Mesorhizobium sp. TaxID=1871066 RepID=UPI000FE75DB4|nr:hypothetical protein [Mesorhizobium sp.]RWL21977.1 MAG: hypothetical protein EOR57_05955 [Mesorhizobium sp.]